MALLLLLVGAILVQVVCLEDLKNETILTSTPHIKVPSTSETLTVNSVISTTSVTLDPNGTVTIGRQTPGPPSTIPLGTSELSSFGTPTVASMSTPELEPTPSQKVSNKTSVQLPEPSNVANESPVSITNPVTDRTVTFTSLETSKGTSAPPVTETTSSKETSGLSVAIIVSSKTSGPPVTMATGSLGPSSETHGLPATIATSLTVTWGTPVSSTKIAAMSTPEPITTGTSSQGSSSMLLVLMLVALLVVLVLVALLLLWRQRQKRRTGALTLSRSGKRNGVVDAWAGPARVPDEEATTASGPTGSKGSGAVETEGSSGQRPMLTTFFSRRKSRQGSLALEELKPGSGPNLKGEEEPLVGSDDEAVETPTSDGLQAKDGSAPQRL